MENAQVWFYNRLTIHFEAYLALRALTFDRKIQALPLFQNCVISYSENNEVKTLFLPQGKTFSLEELAFYPEANQVLTFLFFDIRFQHFPFLPLTDFEKLPLSFYKSFFASIKAELTSENGLAYSHIQALMHYLKGQLVSQWMHQNPESFSITSEVLADERISMALHYIHKNLGHPISLHTLGEAVFHAPAYIGQVMTKKTGFTFRNYLDLARVYNGLRQMALTTRSIKAIAVDNHFADQSYFNRRMKAFFGLSPNQLKKRLADFVENSDSYYKRSHL